VRRALVSGVAVAVLAALVALPAVPGAAWAQGVDIGGTVPATLGLTVTDDGAGGVFHAEVTSTTDATYLTAAGSPGLEVGLGAVFQPLGVPVDPLLKAWSEPLAALPVAVAVRGHARKADPYVLITVSSATP
jgi:hypothetical protein